MQLSAPGNELGTMAMTEYGPAGRAEHHHKSTNPS